MNYIEQIRGFWRSHEEHSFSTNEIALYFYLLEICNNCRWKNPFNRNNAQIKNDLGVSDSVLKNARRKLVERRIVRFVGKQGNANPSYELLKFDDLKGGDLFTAT